MQRELDGSESRRLRLVTRFGVIDGQIKTNPHMSTLHYMNVTAMSAGFVVLHPPIEPSGDWNVAEGALALSVGCVLFARELTHYTPIPGDPMAAAEYQRCAIRLNVGQYAAQGFLHVPPGGDPITRLTQDRHGFIALSSVSVIGPDLQFATPFLAVNRSEVIALQAVLEDAPLDTDFEPEMNTSC